MRNVSIINDRLKILLIAWDPEQTPFRRSGIGKKKNLEVVVELERNNGVPT